MVIWLLTARLKLSSDVFIYNVKSRNMGIGHHTYLYYFSHIGFSLGHANVIEMFREMFDMSLSNAYVCVNMILYVFLIY